MHLHAAPVPSVLPARHTLPPREAPPDEQSDAELLATVIGHNEPWREARARAATLLETAGGVRGLTLVARSHLEQAGLTDETVERLRASIELGHRAACARVPQAPLDRATVVAMMSPLLVHLPHEEIHVVFVDMLGRYRGRRRVASGGMATCALFVRDVLAPVLEARASAFVLLHNHPSGTCAPSADDAAFTARLQAASDVVGVRLVDHLVLADDGHASAMPNAARWTSGTRAIARVL